MYVKKGEIHRIKTLKAPFIAYFTTAVCQYNSGYKSYNSLSLILYMIWNKQRKSTKTFYDACHGKMT